LLLGAGDGKSVDPSDMKLLLLGMCVGELVDIEDATVLLLGVWMFGLLVGVSCCRNTKPLMRTGKKAAMAASSPRLMDRLMAWFNTALRVLFLLLVLVLPVVSDFKRS
jgi:hypothetical protein